MPILVTNPAEPGTFYAPSNRGVHRPDFTTTERRLPGQITVRELLNQTSGLADAGFPAYTLPQPDSLGERVESLRHARLVSKPGTEFHYTDPNYAVLARVVEEASGKSFGEHLRDRVFSPLEMGHTTSVLSSGEAPRPRPTLNAKGRTFSMPGFPDPTITHPLQAGSSACSCRASPVHTATSTRDRRDV